MVAILKGFRKVRNMKLLALQKLMESRFRRNSYSLPGESGDECYKLERERDKWVVYYAERGLRTSLQYFDSEDMACNEFLRLVNNDPNARLP